MRFLLKGSRFYGAFDCIERVHDLLDVCFIHLGEEVLDAVLVLQVMEHDESLPRGCDKGRDEPLIELVNNLEIPDKSFLNSCNSLRKKYLHVRCPQHVLIHKIESSMCDELVQVTMIILPHLEKFIV